VERAYPNAVGPASNDLSGLIPDDHAGAIAIELAERLGPSIDWWLVQPFAYGLWCFYRLHELDRRRTWLARMAGIEAALLTHWAMHNPDGIGNTSSKLIAEAGSDGARRRNRPARARDLGAHPGRGSAERWHPRTK
jgi:hypothetical protein